MSTPYGGHDPSTLVEAVVVKICDTYVVTYPTSNVGDLTTRDSVTFRLDEWRGSDEPQCSQLVKLVNPMVYMRGWRAREAYPVTFNSQQPASKQ